MPCNHLIEIHNDTGNKRVYFVSQDGWDLEIDGAFHFNFCPICGEQLRQVTDTGGDDLS